VLLTVVIKTQFQYKRTLNSYFKFRSYVFQVNKDYHQAFAYKLYLKVQRLIPKYTIDMKSPNLSCTKEAETIYGSSKGLNLKRKEEHIV